MYDGYRNQLVLDGAGGRAFTKMEHDWSKRYWPIVAAVEKLPAKSLILDGEMIAPEPDGRPNFHAMQSRIGMECRAACLRRLRHLAQGWRGSAPAAGDRAQGDSVGPGKARRRRPPVQPVP